jgi:hypothetical protein
MANRYRSEVRVNNQVSGGSCAAQKTPQNQRVPFGGARGPDTRKLQPAFDNGYSMVRTGGFGEHSWVCRDSQKGEDRLPRKPDPMARFQLILKPRARNPMIGHRFHFRVNQKVGVYENHG